MIKKYYELTKPGLVYGNAIAVIAGFALASRGLPAQAGNFNFTLFLQTLAGISLVMASGCVFNNYIDRDIDALMERTKDRALVIGAVSGRGTIVFGTCLGVVGFLALAVWTNLLTVIVALTGFFFYVLLYTILWKRRSVYGTVIGSAAGAVPPVVGYVAVSNSFDAGAAILFSILALWQMPHFYAIAIRRLDDYRAAKIPVLPVVRGVRLTKVAILFYIIAFIIAAAMLAVLGYAGKMYLAVVLTIGVIWLALAIRGFWIADDQRWARGIFLTSLIVLTLLCAVIIVGG